MSNPPGTGIVLSSSMIWKHDPANRRCEARPAPRVPDDAWVTSAPCAVSSSERIDRLSELSSTSRILAPPNAGSRGPDGAVLALAVPNCAVNENALPIPGSLATATLPCISATSRETIASPSPLPPYLREVEESAWVNALNSRWSLSAGIPIPVSVTVNLSPPAVVESGSGSTNTSTCPCWVNLIALPTRLIRIWPSLNGSPSASSGTCGAKRDHQLEAFFMRANRQRLEHLLGHVFGIEFDRLEADPPALDPGEVKDAVDQLEQRVAVADDSAQISALLLAELGFHQQIGHPEDRVHRGANLVRHARQELRLGARRGQRRLARADQFTLGHLEVGYFARNSQAAELSVQLQIQRRNEHRPLRAVLQAECHLKVADFVGLERVDRRRQSFRPDGSTC